MWPHIYLILQQGLRHVIWCWPAMGSDVSFSRKDFSVCVGLIMTDKGLHQWIKWLTIDVHCKTFSLSFLVLFGWWEGAHFHPPFSGLPDCKNSNEGLVWIFNGTLHVFFFPTGLPIQKTLEESGLKFRGDPILFFLFCMGLPLTAKEV